MARERSRLSFLGAPSSAGAFCLGQEDAPVALRRLDLLARLDAVGFEVEDLGDLPLQRWRPDRDSPRAQNVAAVVANAEAVREQVRRALHGEDAFALVVGGDCTTGVGTLAGVTAAFAERPNWIYFDLHADLNTPRNVGSGALDWMGMAHALALPGAVEQLSRLGDGLPLTEPAAVSLFAHDWDRATSWEQDQLEALALRRVTCASVAANPVAAADALLREIDPTRRIVLHFDVDVINFTDAPLSENHGRETGLLLPAALAALNTLLADPRVRALTVTELNPHHAAADPATLPAFVSGLVDALAQVGG